MKKELLSISVRLTELESIKRLIEEARYLKAFYYDDPILRGRMDSTYSIERFNSEFENEFQTRVPEEYRTGETNE